MRNLGQESELYRFQFHALGGGNEIQFYCSQSPKEAEAVAESVIAEVRRIEAKFSRYQDESIVSNINRSAGISAIEVDEETAALLDYAAACHQQSDGLFDITSGVLRRAWNFKSDRIATKEQIQPLLRLVGWEKVRWKRPEIFLPLEGMQIDLGGVGKEYAVDRSAGKLALLGIQSFLINFSGDIRVTGGRLGNLPWNIGIADPRAPQTMLGAIELSSGALATSGDYERMIELNGKRYSHILNPLTGWPAEGLQSVTVLADSCLIAGSVSTTAMLKGAQGVRYLREVALPYIAVTSQGELYCHKTFANYFPPSR